MFQCIRSFKGVSEVKSLSRVRLFVTPWTVAHQASLSMEFSRHEYWSGLPLPSLHEAYILPINIEVKLIVKLDYVLNFVCPKKLS